MNPNEVRAQRQRFSLQKSNAYFFFVSTAATTKASAVVDPPRSLTATPSNELKPIHNERAHSLSPSMSATVQSGVSDKCISPLPGPA